MRMFHTSMRWGPCTQSSDLTGCTESLNKGQGMGGEWLQPWRDNNGVRSKWDFLLSSKARPASLAGGQDLGVKGGPLASALEEMGKPRPPFPHPPPLPGWDALAGLKASLRRPRRSIADTPAPSRLPGSPTPSRQPSSGEGTWAGVKPAPPSPTSDSGPPPHTPLLL